MFLEHSSPLSTGPRQPGVVISVHPVQGKPRFVPAALGSYASRTLPLGGRSFADQNLQVPPRGGTEMPWIILELFRRGT